MRIYPPKIERANGWTRIAATVELERSNQQLPKTLWYEVPEADENLITLQLDSFTVTLLPLATTLKLAHWQLTPGKFIAVNIRIGDYAASGQAYLEAVATRIIELAQAYMMPVVVVPIALDEGDSDVKTGHRLAALINQDWFRGLEEPGLTASLVKGILGQAYAGLGVSYHFCTFALTQGVPAIALFDGDYYTQKAQGISSFWEDSRLAMSLNQLRQPEAHQQIREVFEDRELRQALACQAPIVVQQWHEIFDKQSQKLLRTQMQ